MGRTALPRSALPRLVAAAFVILAIVVAVIEFDRDRDGDEAMPVATPNPVAPSPLRGELQRCQALGEAAVEDAACLEAWAETRRRFLGAPSDPDGSD